MAKRITDYDIPDGYDGPEIFVVTKNPDNHKPHYERATPRNGRHETLYLVERILRKCKYFDEPSGGSIYYWAGSEECREILEWVLSNPSMWEFPGSEEDVSSLRTVPFEEDLLPYAADCDFLEESVDEGEPEKKKKTRAAHPEGD